MGIRDQPTSPRSPWQNGYAERLIGSIRRECLDHVVVLGECHLRHLLLSYMKYYNGTRTHLSLEKDAPFSRAVERAGRFFAAQFSAGCTTNMSGFDCRQAQVRGFAHRSGFSTKGPIRIRIVCRGSR
jgi:transposase InsO family protein